MFLHPILFFIDYKKNKLLREGIVWIPKYQRGSIKSNIKYSIVTAAYNVSKYIKYFILSCENQTLLPFEIIIVDDGSTDNTLDIIKEYSKRYKNIKYICKKNGGQSSARNMGLNIISGDYVTFIDPDDFIDSKYIENVDKIVKLNNSDLINCNIVIYREQLKKYTNNHFLKKLFKNNLTTFYSTDIPENIVINNVARTFFRVSLIKKNNLQFEEKLREFEDGHFTLRFIMDNFIKISLVKDAKYYNRRRSDLSSTMQTSWIHKDAYIDIFKYGYNDIIKKYAKPKLNIFLQTAIMVQLAWHIKEFINNEPPMVLSKDEINLYINNIKNIMQYIDKSIICTFNYCGITYKEQVGILGLFKNEDHICNNVYIEEIDYDKKIMRISSYFYPDKGQNICIYINKKKIDINHKKVRIYKFIGKPFVNENVIWIPLDYNKDYCININNKRTKIRVAKKWVWNNFYGGELKLGNKEINLKKIIINKLYSISNKYNDAWMIMDRISSADDNGEHLYRYIMNHDNNINCYFVLNKKSTDWNRLKKEGFKLVQYHSLSHFLLFLKAKYFISSQCDSNQLFLFKNILEENRFKFIFLQHGVIKDNLSNWLNKYKIDLFVTSTYDEYKSITMDSQYKFSAKEVILTGLPRFDYLYKNKNNNKDKKVITFMPTWRKNLVGGFVGKFTDNRKKNDLFYSSMYANNWKKLLHDKRLNELYDDGIEIIFWPHINMFNYLDFFEAPKFIKIGNYKSGNIQNTFIKSSIFVTDYSSTAFDAAYIKRNIIYYQFDKNEFFSGKHTYTKGYFSYENNGFGPVVTNINDLFNAIQIIIDNDYCIDNKYSYRIDNTFFKIDDNNCFRVFDKIKNL